VQGKVGNARGKRALAMPDRGPDMEADPCESPPVCVCRYLSQVGRYRSRFLHQDVPTSIGHVTPLQHYLRCFLILPQTQVFTSTKAIFNEKIQLLCCVYFFRMLL
jgi:hypothetical protein